jgi:type IV pilus assembly protein PilC
LRSNAQDPEEQALMASLYEAANAGESVAETLKAKGVLPDYANSLIAIGEQTGRMEETFGSLADYYSKRDELAQSIRSSVVYPLSMLVMVFVVVAVLLVQVMPVFDHVFRQLGYEMSGIAAALLAFGNGLGQVGFWVAGIIFVVAIIAVILALTPGGKRFYANLFQGAPITRDLSLNLSAQRFSLALAAMLNAGLDLNEALSYAEPLVDDKRAKLSVAKIKRSVESGEAFLPALEKSGLYGHKDMAMLAVGCKTGADAEALNQVGTQITTSTENRLERLVAAIEPTLVAIMCILVGIILLSVMLPLMGALTGF